MISTDAASVVNCSGMIMTDIPTHSQYRAINTGTDARIARITEMTYKATGTITEIRDAM